jgi:hypothetical protein
LLDGGKNISTSGVENDTLSFENFSVGLTVTWDNQGYMGSRFLINNFFLMTCSPQTEAV